MFLLNLSSDDPFFNLAAEEYLLKKRSSEFLLIYVNSQCVVTGKHQVAHREADTKFVTEHEIPVLRRISGGGTVFHDEGNLNFSFISQSAEGKQVDFRKYTLPVIKFLSVIGVEARFEGKNDLRVNGLKISGNSEHVHRNRVLHHGTLLFNSKLDFLKGSLRKDTSKYLSRAVNSNPSPVTNLNKLIPNVRDMNDLRKKMVLFFLDENGYKLVNLSPEEKNEIEALSAAKYRTWEWNYAYGPEYEFSNQFEINGLHIDCRLFVKDGIIKECSIKGSPEMAAIAKGITGCRHMPDDLGKVFIENNILITKEEIFRFF